MDMNEIITLRCCRDWPVHRYYAYTQRSRCGICRQIPEVIEEIYPEEKYARNNNRV